MGLFGLGKRKVNVTVHGANLKSAGADGRYGKQVRQAKKAEKKKEKELVLQSHTPAELRAYIEEKYGVEELTPDDARFRKAFSDVKAHLVFLHAPELIPTAEMRKPKHPPVSDTDPDYEQWRENQNRRWKEAATVPAKLFTVHLHVYNIPIFLNDIPVSWVEVYIESAHEYLSFKVIDLEYEDHYLTNDTIRDIVRYFGANPADKKAKNERYIQLVSMQ